MKQKRGIVCLLAALVAVLLTVVAGWQEQDAVSLRDVRQHADLSVVIPQRQQPHEATLSDASQLYRICSSRPQRILPTQGGRNERTLTPSFSFARLHIVKPLRSYYDGRCRLESAPFCLSASRDYYVIALRHIIR